MKTSALQIHGKPRTSQRIKDSNEITEENKKIALNFKDYLLSEGT
jgi:hypothetical protein